MQIIQAERAIIGDGKTVIEKGAVVVADGKILEIGTGENLQIKYPQAQLFDYPNCTLLPGLVDVHVHISGLYRRPEKQEMQENPAFLALLVVKHLQDALSAGITTLRGVGEAKGIGAAIRGAYQRKYIRGPRYYTCERSLTRTGGHGSTGEVAKIEVDGPWNLRQAVRSNIKEGADWIKVMNSHRSSHSEYTLEELAAVTDEAHRLGKKCCIHAGTIQSIELAIEAGFDSLEHAPFLTEELADKALQKGIAWVPTVYVYQQAVDYTKRTRPIKTAADLEDIQFLVDTVQGYEDNLLRNYRKGMLIATGTDICFPEMFITPIQDEIKALCGLGLSNLEAIACATANGAKLLDAEEIFGQLKPGLCADLLLVEGNPVSDIDALRNVCSVYRDGELLYNNTNEKSKEGM